MSNDINIGDVLAEQIDLVQQAEDLLEKVESGEVTEDEAVELFSVIESQGEKLEDIIQDATETAREERHERLYGTEEKD